MLQYLFEIVLWTIILYGLILVIKKLILRFIISTEKIKELKKLGYIKKEKYNKD